MIPLLYAHDGFAKYLPASTSVNGDGAPGRFTGVAPQECDRCSRVICASGQNSRAEQPSATPDACIHDTASPRQPSTGTSTNECTNGTVVVGGTVVVVVVVGVTVVVVVVVGGTVVVVVVVVGGTVVVVVVVVGVGVLI